MALVKSSGDALGEDRGRIQHRKASRARKEPTDVCSYRDPSVREDWGTVATVSIVSQ